MIIVGMVTFISSGAQFTPAFGPVGTTVTITGSNFSATPANNIVYFGATRASVTSSTTTQLVVIVPPGATYEPVSITVNGLNGFTAKPFPVVFTSNGLVDATSFSSKVDFSTHTSYVRCYSMVIGDLDGDGKSDMAVANYDLNAISVYKNTSSTGLINENSFAAKTDFSSPGGGPYGLAIGDLNGDGKLDVAVANRNKRAISVFKNTSSGPGVVSFLRSDFTTDTDSTFSIAIGDMDGDGKPDLVTSNKDAKVSVFRNTSTTDQIVFAAKVDFATVSTYNFDVALGDLDNDNKPDIIVPNFDGTVSVYKSNATPGVISTTSFPTHVEFTIGQGATGIIVADLDGDNKLDIATSNATTNSVSVVRNTNTVSGTMSFAPSIDFNLETGFAPRHITVGDLNGDGKPDLVVANRSADKISIFKNSSTSGSITTGSFTSKVDFATGSSPWNVAIADIDNDGKQDLAVVNASSYSVSVFRNKIADATAPSITSFTPQSGLAGSSVTIYGANFSNSTALNTIKFNGVQAVITSGNTTALSVTVPTGAITGPISISSGGQTRTSTTSFVVRSVEITNETFISILTKGVSTQAVSITVSDATKVSIVNFKSRGISEPVSSIKSISLSASGNKYEKVFSATDISDPIGLLYWFEVVDKTQTLFSSNIGKAYIKYPLTSSDQAIPKLAFGTSAANYQIIAVPLELKTKNASSVFSALGEYNKSKWRLFDYANGANREYPAFGTIDVGKGYWFIARNNIIINPGEGTTVQVDEDSPYTVNLTAGWNLIGNPYNFKISWQDVLTLNGNPPGVEKIKIFSNGALHESSVLDRYQGAFVFTDKTMALKISPIQNKNIGGRLAERDVLSNPLDMEHWEINLSLREGELSNEVGGIGMHPEARLMGKDRFDEVSVPLPEGLGLFEIAFQHPEVRATFNKEIVPTAENYTWDFDIKRSSFAQLKLMWRNDFFGANGKEIVLFDPATLKTIDMRAASHYELSERTKNLRILFGSEAYVRAGLETSFPGLGEPYPNPSGDEVTIPFTISKSDDEKLVKINVYNSQGIEMTSLVDGFVNHGRHEVVWDSNGKSGLYFIRMVIGNATVKTVKAIIE
jgi:hypothetical protein